MHVWDTIRKFTPQLNELQQKCETLSDAVPPDPNQLSMAYWTRVGENFIALAKELKSHQQVRCLDSLTL